MDEVAIGGCLGHSDHGLVKFKIFGDRGKTATKPLTLGVGRADFRLLRELVMSNRKVPLKHNEDPSLLVNF